MLSAQSHLESPVCTYGPKLPNGDCPAAPAFDLASSRPVAVNGRCEAGQRLGTGSDGVQTCFDPHDAAELAEHLKECALDRKPDAPESARDPIVADKFGVPCNPYDQFDNDCPAPPAAPWPGCVSHAGEPWKKFRKLTSAGQPVPPEDLPPEFICPPGVPSTPGRCFQPASSSASK